MSMSHKLNVMVKVIEFRHSSNPNAELYPHPDGLPIPYVNGKPTMVAINPATGVQYAPEQCFVNISDGTRGVNAEGAIVARPYLILVLVMVSNHQRTHTSVVNYWGRFPNNGGVRIAWQQGMNPVDIVELLDEGIDDIDQIAILLKNVSKRDRAPLMNLTMFELVKELRSVGLEPSPVGEFVTIPDATDIRFENYSVAPYNANGQLVEQNTQYVFNTVFGYKSYDIAEKKKPLSAAQELSFVNSFIIGNQDLTMIKTVDGKVVSTKNWKKLEDERSGRRLPTFGRFLTPSEAKIATATKIGDENFTPLQELESVAIRMSELEKTAMITWSKDTTAEYELLMLRKRLLQRGVKGVATESQTGGLVSSGLPGLRRAGAPMADPVAGEELVADDIATADSGGKPSGKPAKK